MLSFGFCLLLMSGLLLVAYLKIICRPEIPYNIVPQNIRAVFNYEVWTTFTWIIEAHKRLQGEVRCQFICDLYYPSFSCAITHLSALVIDEGRGTSYASLTQVAGGWLPDERGNGWLSGQRSQRAAGHLADLWLRTSHVSQNSLMIGLDQVCSGPLSV